MATDEEYNYSEESSSFLSNIRRNLNVVTINEYVMVILTGFSIFLLSGLVYVLAETPDIVHSDSRGTQLVYNFPPQAQGQKMNIAGLGTQYVLEMFIVAGIIGMGVIGLYLIKNATSYIDDQRKALQVLIIGTLLFLLAAMLLFFLYMYKMTGNFPSFVGLG